MSDDVVRDAFDPGWFRRQGHAVVDQLASYLERALAGAIPVSPGVPPNEMLQRWARTFTPEGGAEVEPIFERVIADSVHQHHPGFTGHQVTAPLPLAALCDLVAALLNNGMAGYESGPAATAIESAVIGELARRVGYARDADGVLTSGGSLGNLTALLAARQARAGYDVWEEGVAKQGLAIIASEHVHYSIARAARIMGLGRDGIVTAAVDDRYRMTAAGVADAFARAQRAGRRVFAVVATAGSTATGSIDPLPELAALAAEHGAWFHVDGAHGASSVLSERMRDRVAGLAAADSIVWDAHKMMLQPALATAVLYKSSKAARGTFAQDASYLYAPGEEDRDRYDLGQRTVECTKRMMGLKLYASLAVHGTKMFGDYVARTFDLASTLVAKLRAAPDFEALHEPDTNIVCFRYRPAGSGDLDALQRKVKAGVGGNHIVLTTKLPVGEVLRVVLMNPFTTERELDGLLAAIRAV